MKKSKNERNNENQKKKEKSRKLKRKRNKKENSKKIEKQKSKKWLKWEKIKKSKKCLKTKKSPLSPPPKKKGERRFGEREWETGLGLLAPLLFLFFFGRRGGEVTPPQTQTHRRRPVVKRALWPIDSFLSLKSQISPSTGKTRRVREDPVDPSAWRTRKNSNKRHSLVAINTVKCAETYPHDLTHTRSVGQSHCLVCFFLLRLKGASLSRHAPGAPPPNRASEPVLNVNLEFDLILRPSSTTNDRDAKEWNPVKGWIQLHQQATLTAKS